jgi:acyl-CoA synthetase (NDP forming)
MITRELLDPQSIVVVGGSNDIQKPGGKVVKNIIDGNYRGKLYVTNRKEDIVQGIPSFKNPEDLPAVDLAIIAIAAKYVPDAVEILARDKGTRGFIILSAGFSEENEEGRLLEKRIVDSVNAFGGSLIGPNCIGVLTPEYHGVFTKPIPRLDLSGCDFISGSGATACFIMESGIPNGLGFARVFSVGNSAQMGVEEILEHMDVSFDPAKSPRVKLLYMESISKPGLLLKHASSLIRKGCKIAAIKAGTSEAGSRAASSHTGALASSDLAVDSLFKKAGIIRCYSRQELISVASVFMYKELKGKNIAIITHAGGPAVIMTDVLSKGGFSVPRITNPKSGELLEQLFPGSSVTNPIDFLATGTSEQLGKIIDFTDNYFEEIDGMVVIFGTPGLIPVSGVYNVLHEKMKSAGKPIFPVLPSVLTAKQEVEEFLAKGHINFPDEAVLANALIKVYASENQLETDSLPFYTDNQKIRDIIEKSNEGYLPPASVQELLDAAGIPRVKEVLANRETEAATAAAKLGYPVVMKAVGPVHKSDIGGVRLNIMNDETVKAEFRQMMNIDGVRQVLIQPMLKGTELFIGAKYEARFGHMILCGLGGIFVEVLKDVSAGLVPLSPGEAAGMIRELKAYPIIHGIRGQKGLNEELFTEIMVRLSLLLQAAPEIFELDINPLIGYGDKITAVDARIRILKTK